MAFYLDDLDEFFSDFQESITVPGTGGFTFPGIFDAAQEYVDAQTGQIVVAEPTITAQTGDTPGIARGSSLVIDLVTYKVLDRRDDRTGISVFRLSKQ